ncbi:MAG TPA: hypothetical protein VK658_05740 [Chryseolinea sp.]|nr:hypothetical protein [Chryseolinea sp.]
MHVKIDRVITLRKKVFGYEATSDIYTSEMIEAFQSRFGILFNRAIDVLYGGLYGAVVGRSATSLECLYDDIVLVWWRRWKKLPLNLIAHGNGT